jgi:16S rRNA (adenine1518-N6/adenine1519-N6)-dimethyltransferase
VIAIERDRDLLPVLRELFEQPLSSGQLQLLEADAKQVDWSALFASEEGAPRPWDASSRRVLAGNLPYQITGPLLENAVATRTAFDLGVFLVQKEVADRLSAAPGSKSYGALSVFCQAAFEVRREFIVRRGAFYPQPNVDSAVVTLSCARAARAAETPAYRAVVKAAFHERRKVLRNAWSGVCGASRDQLEQCAKDAAVSLEARGETLAVADFARMAECLERLSPGASEGHG